MKKNTLTLTLDQATKAQQVRQLARQTNGRFFTVGFIKKDGSKRLLTGRLGVKAPLVGGENTVKHIDKYLTVYDTTKKQYRNVNLETVFMFHAQGNRIDFKEAVFEKSHKYSSIYL